MRLKIRKETYNYYLSAVYRYMKSLFIFLLLALLLNSCYSFRGVSIPSDVKTFYVRQVKLTDFAAPADTPEK